jgi:hypothetical protein
MVWPGTNSPEGRSVSEGALRAVDLWLPNQMVGS